AKKIGADIVELHTGAFANAQGGAQTEQLGRLRTAADHAADIGLQVNAGHGINYSNISQIVTLPHLVELNIGHSIVSRAILTGLGPAVAQMVDAMQSHAGTKRS